MLLNGFAPCHLGVVLLLFPAWRPPETRTGDAVSSESTVRHFVGRQVGRRERLADGQGLLSSMPGDSGDARFLQSSCVDTKASRKELGGR